MYYPILFSWEQKSMFSCWVFKTKSKPIAVKYVKKYKSLEETSLMWGYGLQFFGGICHNSAIQKKKKKNYKNKNSQRLK